MSKNKGGISESLVLVIHSLAKRINMKKPNIENRIPLTLALLGIMLSLISLIL